MTLPLNKDWLEFLELLNANGVEYLIVGALAVAHHGRPRLTGDLDVWLKPESGNAKRILESLRQFGFASLSLTENDFAESCQVIQLGFPPMTNMRRETLIA